MINKVINNYKINFFKSKEDFLNQIKDKKKILIAMNAEKILKKDDRLRDIINNNIAYPDGVGAVMALKQKGVDAVKIPGSEFWLDIVSAFYKEKSFYILGTTADVIENTVLKLKEEFSNINIVGYRDGFLKDDDKEKLKETLVTLKPDVIFVAQGSPRQEFLMDELIKIHPALYMGLGGSFDIYGGDKKRAPKLFLDFHLEWLYRLLKEPTRVGRQIIYIKFMILLKVGKL